MKPKKGKRTRKTEETNSEINTLHHVLELVQEINRGNKNKIQDLIELTSHQPEVLARLSEAILNLIVQGEAQEFRWRTKLESLSQAKFESSPLLNQEWIPLQINENEALMDLSKAIFIPKLSNLIKELLKEIKTEITNSQGDMVISHPLEPDFVPELIALGFKHVIIYVRSEMVRKFQASQEDLSQSLTTIFHSFQIPNWGCALFLNEQLGTQAAGLLFPFYYYSKPHQTEYFCLVEYDKMDEMLRITLDDPQNPLLNLKNIPHVIVPDLDKRVHIEDLKYVAKTVYFEILRAKENSNRQIAYHFGTQKDYGIFKDLQKAGFTHLNTLMFYWSNQTEVAFMSQNIEQSTAEIGRILLALEEKNAIEHLKAGKSLQVTFDPNRSAYLDISMRGQWLNIAFDVPRTHASTLHYFNRLPHIKSVSQEPKQAFKNIDILLIHHLTPEILAFIRGLDQQGSNTVQVLFVRYNPNIPSHYREAVLTLPEERFHFATLQKCSDKEFMSDYFTLSEQFSSLKETAHLKEVLDVQKLDFFAAMRLCAGQFFLRRALRAKERGSQILLIEDGGYLAPFLNQLCLEGKTVREALQEYAFSTTEIEFFAKQENLDQPLGKWLKPLFIGSVEHTRNGYDALIDIATQYSKLAFPACSIAISNLKRFKESKEVAISIIHAVESILHTLGFVLSQRRALVFGSRGTVGSHLIAQMSERVTLPVLGVDLQVKDIALQGQAIKGCIEAPLLTELPQAQLHQCDLFVGVIGKSIFTEEQIADLLIHSNSPHLFFASGSTKKAEFTHLLHYLHQLQNQESPEISGIPVILEETEIRDPGSYAYLGRCVRISIPASYQNRIHPVRNATWYFVSPPPEGYILWKELFLLGDLMPINFYYSGVPTEIIDLVLTQLMEVARGLALHHQRHTPLPNQVLAVDHEIDFSGNAST